MGGLVAVDNSSSPLIRLRGISFGYPGRKQVLDGLDFTLHRGDRVGLIGPNGSGKTTLFHVIMGLVRPTGGTVELFGRPAGTEKDFREVYRRIGFLFQDSDDQLFSPTVLEDVAFGPLNLGLSRADAVAVARKTLADLGLEGFEDRITHRLSGGEKRLVSLATVLAMEPEVLLLDEPSTGLDQETKETLTQVLNRFALSCIVISHEIEFMEGITDVVYQMENGRILTDYYVHAHPHSHPHTCHDHNEE